MIEKTSEKTVLRLAEPLVAALGLEIWGLEIVPSGRPVVRLFVDLPQSRRNMAAETEYVGTEPPERSASIDQCEEISRQLGLALDVEDCMPSAWQLEVSTPGLSRRFFRLEQMRPYIGDIVEVRLSEPLPGTERRAYQGILRSVSDDSFTIEPCSVSGDGEISPTGEEPAALPWALAARVRRNHIFTPPARPGRRNGKRKAGQKPDKGRPPEEK